MQATKAKDQHKWAMFLSFYSKQYAGRKTRLGIFENFDGVMNELWIEDGLPLSEIYVDEKARSPSVNVLLGGYSHTVARVVSLRVHYTLESDQDGIDLVADNGQTTIVRFEDESFG
jgi:hypothetical protein